MSKQLPVLPAGADFCEGVYKTPSGFVEPLPSGFAMNPETGAARGLLYHGQCNYQNEDAMCQMIGTGIRDSLFSILQQAKDAGNGHESILETFESFSEAHPLLARLIKQEGFVGIKDHIKNQRTDLEALFQVLEIKENDVQGKCPYKTEKSLAVHLTVNGAR
jgi:hypothetical protein